MVRLTGTVFPVLREPCRIVRDLSPVLRESFPVVRDAESGQKATVLGFREAERPVS